MILTPKLSPCLDALDADAPGLCAFGGGGGAPAGYSQQNATTTSSTAPWAGQQPYFLEQFNAAGRQLLLRQLGGVAGEGSGVGSQGLTLGDFEGLRTAGRAARLPPGTGDAAARPARRKP